MASVFETLNSVNVNGHTEKKKAGGKELTYLSWAWAWAEVKKRYPEATYTVYERPDGCIYWTDGKTCWVKTGVTIDGLEHIEYLPVMDYRNQSVLLDNVTSMDVNKAIQRSLTKAAARHGLGLYIYAGEDLPDGEREEIVEAPSELPKTHTQIVMDWIKAKGMTGPQFGTIRDSAAAQGIIPDKKVHALSDTEFAALMSYAETQAS